MNALPPLPGPHKGLKIGLLGGSFNPAHDGHLHVAETALKRLGLDWVWWLVAYANPLKDRHGDLAVRLASAAQIAAQNPRMIATDIEAQLGLTYTIDTLAALQARAPDTDFVWLMGADNLSTFHLWKDWQGLAARVPIAIIARPGAGAAARRSPFARTYASARLPEAEALALPACAAPAWAYLTAPLNPASSTVLRAKSCA